MKVTAQRNTEDQTTAVAFRRTNGPNPFGLSTQNRPEAALQRKIQPQSHKGLAVAQARAIQNTVNASPQVKQLKALQA